MVKDRPEIKKLDPKQMFVIALTGSQEVNLENMMGESDIELRIQSDRASRIKEVHLVAIHSICELIEQRLFGI